MDSKKIAHMVAFSLLIVGGLNWGTVGFAGFNIVEMFFGTWPILVQVIYILVGVSAVYIAATHMNDCKICAKK